MSLPSVTKTADKTITAVLILEALLEYSRKVVTVLAGSGAARVLALGAVLGARLFGAPVITPDGGNTGDGALGTLVLKNATKVGDYIVTCIAAATNGGRFQVVDPDGFRMADALATVAYAEDQLGFTITDGAADWAVDDFITVAIPAGDGKVVALDTTATDGTQLADSILMGAVTAPDGADADGSGLARDALVTDAGLVWPGGISAPDKAAALARLETAGIFTRQAA